MTMQSYDPYQAPIAPAAPVAAPTDVQARMIEAMRQTRPWVLLLSVLGFVGAGGMVLVGILVSVVGSLGDAIASAGAFPGFGAVVGVVYIALGAIYVVPSWLLWRYAASIGRFLEGGTLDQLATAVGAQKSFWRFTGICMLVVIVLYLAAIFLGVIVAMVTAAGR